MKGRNVPAQKTRPKARPKVIDLNEIRKLDASIKTPAQAEAGHRSGMAYINEAIRGVYNPAKVEEYREFMADVVKHAAPKLLEDFYRILKKCMVGNRN